MPLHRNFDRSLTSGRRGERRTSIIGAAFSVVLAAAIVGGYGSVARAGDYDDPSGESFGSKLRKAIGLPDPDHPDYEINYSERSPLVVPPNRNLPPPISTNGPPAANWPQDPDIKKQQANKKEVVHVEGDRVIEDGRPLRPDELIPKGSSSSSGSGEIETKKSSFFNFDWANKEQYGTFTGEPARASLTDPPPGYQTPSPDQPYGIPPDRKGYKPKTLGERMEPER